MYTLEELYGVDRAQYCKVTGVSPKELIRHLEAEISMLSRNYEVLSEQYRGSTLMSPQLRDQELLLHEISKRIEAKKAKLLQIEREFLPAMSSLRKVYSFVTYTVYKTIRVSHKYKNTVRPPKLTLLSAL